jgi:dihydroorotate dehydrogenase electron transfer subunit
MKAQLKCIDVNTPYCPCLLAETNHCVLCSHLQGKNFCDCDWNGLCILNEKQWQPTMNITEDMIFRQELETKIIVKEQISENTYLIGFEVNEELAKALQKVGSFVFLRRLEDPQVFHFPVGIMKVCGNEITVVIESRGPKSTRLLEAETGKILVRGPYFNGLFGQPWIDVISCGTILVVAGGLGQSPALPIIETLVVHNNQVVAILAPGQAGKIFVAEELTKLGVTVKSVASFRKEGLYLLNELFINETCRPDLVVSAGPDAQHKAIIKAMQTANVNLPLVATNNANMCCGEGICGSCDRMTKDHQKIRTCKVQTEFINLIDE